VDLEGASFGCSITSATGFPPAVRESAGEFADWGRRQFGQGIAIEIVSRSSSSQHRPVNPREAIEASFPRSEADYAADAFERLAGFERADWPVFDEALYHLTVGYEQASKGS
jgi:hypothetical protein